MSERVWTLAASSLSSSRESANARVYRDTICLSLIFSCSEGMVQATTALIGARDADERVRATVAVRHVSNIVEDGRMAGGRGGGVGACGVTGAKADSASIN